MTTTTPGSRPTYCELETSLAQERAENTSLKNSTRKKVGAGFLGGGVTGAIITALLCTAVTEQKLSLQLRKIYLIANQQLLLLSIITAVIPVQAILMIGIKTRLQATIIKLT